MSLHPQKNRAKSTPILLPSFSPIESLEPRLMMSADIAGTASSFDEVDLDAYPAALVCTANPSAPQVSAAAANNNFANRSVITTTANVLSTTTATNAQCTKETGEASIAGNAGGKSIWWTWTATANGRLGVNTIGSNFNTLVGVYTGSSVSNLTLVASNDDYNGATTSRVIFNVTAGTTYQIAVDGYNGDSGNITLNLTHSVTAAGPTNNTFASATALTLTPNVVSTVTATNAQCTKETGEASIAGNAGGKSIWWTWTATANGRLGINTTSSNFNTLLGVYTGSSVSNLTLVASNDDYNGATTSRVLFNVISGTTYRIAVDGYNGASGNITMNLTFSVAPSAPTGVAATDGQFNGRVLVSWNAASGATAYEVWRSTTNDSATATKISSSDVTTTSYNDIFVTANTNYYYWVKAKNGSGTSGFSSSNVGYRIANTQALSVTTRYGGELVITGSTGTDDISVSQSGNQLTITTNGTTTTASAPTMGLFIYSFSGYDTITIDASVTVLTTVASIDNAITRITNQSSSAILWMDSNDLLTGIGSTHYVTTFYGGVSKATGASLADPSDIGTKVQYTASLFGTGPVAADVNQGYVGDCYYLATIASLASSTPNQLRNLAVDLGDGTYAVQFTRNGIQQFVRVDRDMSTSYAHRGSSGNLWALVLEKAYAAFRTGANTFASLNAGWMGAVMSDFGIANSWCYFSSFANETAFYNTVTNTLSAGKAYTVSTYNSVSNLVGNHAYSLTSVTINQSGQKLYTVRNPWGISGTSSENSSGYATLTYAQILSNIQAVAYVV